jgi:type IV pilus assembly protein PilA
MTKQNKNKGFSLVELVVCVVILAVFAAVLIPAFINLRRESQQDTDNIKFSSMCDVFKKSMAEPEVKRSFEDNGEEEITICFHINDDGTIVFGEGNIKYIEKKDDEYQEQSKEIKDTALWLNSYQTIGTRYEVQFQEYAGCCVRFSLTPKTSKTTAKCSYEIIDVCEIHSGGV